MRSKPFLSAPPLEIIPKGHQGVNDIESDIRNYLGCRPKDGDDKNIIKKKQLVTKLGKELKLVTDKTVL